MDNECTGDKPYKCKECHLAFTRACNAEEHMRTHTGEKPFKRTEYDFACTQEGDLKQHMRTHTGDKLEKPKEWNRNRQEKAAWQQQTKAYQKNT